MFERMWRDELLLYWKGDVVLEREINYYCRVLCQ